VKGLVGTNTSTPNSRLCMSSAVAAYKQTLGADAPPCAYEDFAPDRHCVLIAGANRRTRTDRVPPHRGCEGRARPDMKIIVVDPRRTDTAATADLHLPILPARDIWLYKAMLNVLLWEGLVDYAFVRRAHRRLRGAGATTCVTSRRRVAAEVCGLGKRGADDIVTAARWWGEAKAAMSLWCQGLNQSTHGTHNALR